MTFAAAVGAGEGNPRARALVDAEGGQGHNQTTCVFSTVGLSQSEKLGEPQRSINPK